MADVTRAYSIADLRRMAERALPRAVPPSWCGECSSAAPARSPK